uniref:Uncharacterized protein n=1 Tax=Ulva partita TaxID=1605170 RepID=A0A1C9ZWB0_9CHLO|nr:hypothetical protein [Ulva partita]
MAISLGLIGQSPVDKFGLGPTARFSTVGQARPCCTSQAAKVSPPTSRELLLLQRCPHQVGILSARLSPMMTQNVQCRCIHYLRVCGPDVETELVKGSSASKPI